MKLEVVSEVRSNGTSYLWAFSIKTAGHSRLRVITTAQGWRHIKFSTRFARSSKDRLSRKASSVNPRN